MQIAAGTARLVKAKKVESTAIWKRPKKVSVSKRKLPLNSRKKIVAMSMTLFRLITPLMKITTSSNIRIWIMTSYSSEWRRKRTHWWWLCRMCSSKICRSAWPIWGKTSRHRNSSRCEHYSVLFAHCLPWKAFCFRKNLFIISWKIVYKPHGV